ncbi:MAG: hypothetical protein HYT81_08350 [Gemmatimonadetes bacterium]|nr:hypothetical protein [Gemmatimonadota bacterium]
MIVTFSRRQVAPPKEGGRTRVWAPELTRRVESVLASLPAETQQSRGPALRLNIPDICTPHWLFLPRLPTCAGNLAEPTPRVMPRAPSSHSPSYLNDMRRLLFGLDLAATAA